VYAVFNKVRTAPRYRRNPKGVKAYLKLCQKNANRARVLLEALAEVEESSRVQAEIRRYLDYMELFADQVRRRILDGEKIPYEENVFSVHKPHTRWINKGKAGVVAELGFRPLWWRTRTSLYWRITNWYRYHSITGSLPNLILRY
jgi:hypothetical protein